MRTPGYRFAFVSHVPFFARGRMNAALACDVERAA